MHRIGFLLSDGFQIMALAAQSVFEYANLTAGEPFYAMDNYSVDGGEVRSSLGLRVATRPLRGRRTDVDTWIVAGVNDPLASPAPAAVVAFLRRANPRARRIAGICTGAFVLAEAGLLAQRRATTHWAFGCDMQKRFPDVRVEEDRIYIVDGPVWTSAGMTAGLDLALAMVEKDLGAEAARSVAHKLVMQQRRAGGQSQHSEMLDLAPKSDRIQNALNYARQNLGRALTVEALADAVHLSPRQFSRVFTLETGQSPAKAIERLRLEAARLMIEQSRHSLDVIAKENGFRDRRHLRDAFVRGFGVPPQAIRRDARADVGEAG
ncbi:GlxA family transcriptional regulator [Burkholderia vietnamiensis]|uniref:GlxA family transcriptional regulator n=1 Tax=Burkholderia TaxID=32008 RepID=UPI00075F5E28|nr:MULTISPECIES: GlxA family transcriptional regulator [Burkholderia]AOK12566.1 AraC family transcriptional regulator [Burkholderia vietnamiensis]KVE22564.1 AraC family transcriptional regulator [Burkholderia vietnamiensis]KVF34176.1 AraC family transcriptional regulator [Burkholderia vietnamiensis]KVF39574.1 AraC family transcriptional regulator [Burkholderia vietnamiensis]KVF39996.1 AraC family transcriptional regulator [Burkholderia vietnamiensis]